MERILIADDEESIRFVLKKAMEKKGYSVELAEDGIQAIEKVKGERYSLIFMDIMMPGESGLDILTKVTDTPVIIMTAQDTMRNAVEAMKRGAYDYITKPFDIEEVNLLAARAINAWKLSREVAELKKEIRGKYAAGGEIIGKSDAMKQLYKLIGKVSASDLTVLIQGESGTGKELIAKAIHYHSNRSSGPFIAINSSAIPKDLLESEFFGHEKGAFTGAHERKIGKFEVAEGGTLFLDEIGDMPIDLQAKILRVIQEKEFERVGGNKPIPADVRIITATNRNLEKAIQEGRFRDDLFYRLNVVPIVVPPLKDRAGDVPLLVEHFLRRFRDELDVEEKGIAPEAIKILNSYTWPGNVRELENTVKRAMVMSSGNKILPEGLPTAVFGEAHVKAGRVKPLDRLWEEKLKTFIDNGDCLKMKGMYDLIMKQVERPLLRFVLEKTNGNQLKASEILGINRNTLRKKLTELEMDAKGNPLPPKNQGKKISKRTS
ncbi:MAG: sigma-54-dependent Fis family transcriptional regulator [Deltaproteobacteria bacterium]|nr:sigma-54-dependent Fis family transcriptional regulator [Deltaproteobacteria bacterium]